MNIFQQYWPQIVIAILLAMNFGIVLTRFGELKRASYGWTELVIAPALWIWLLHEGGFW
jgi:hypothetical protein